MAFYGVLGFEPMALVGAPLLGLLFVSKQNVCFGKLVRHLMCTIIGFTDFDRCMIVCNVDGWLNAKPRYRLLVRVDLRILLALQHLADPVLRLRHEVYGKRTCFPLCGAVRA